MSQERYLLLRADAETRKLQARQRAKAMLEASKMPSRMEASSNSSQDTSASRRAKKDSSVDPKWGQKYTALKKLGELPDFDGLHKDWDNQLAKAHGAAKRKSTIPEVGQLKKLTPNGNAHAKLHHLMQEHFSIYPLKHTLRALLQGIFLLFPLSSIAADSSMCTTTLLGSCMSSSRDFSFARMKVMRKTKRLKNRGESKLLDY